MPTNVIDCGFVQASPLSKAKPPVEVNCGLSPSPQAVMKPPAEKVAGVKRATKNASP